MNNVIIYMHYLLNLQKTKTNVSINKYCHMNLARYFQKYFLPQFCDNPLLQKKTQKTLSPFVPLARTIFLIDLDLMVVRLPLTSGPVVYYNLRN